MSEVEKEGIDQKTIINLVGPSAVGKTSLIDYIDASFNHFSKVTSYTTRPQRTGERADNYRFLDSTAINLDELKARSLQFDQFPGTEVIYGTEPEDYKNKYNLLDTLSSSVDTFRGLGFAACRQFIIVASPLEWENRIKQREFSKPVLKNRLEEAKNSLTWAQEQQDRVQWIYNQDSNLEKVASLIVDLSTDDETCKKFDDSNPKEIGSDLLQYIKYLIYRRGSL